MQTPISWGDKVRTLKGERDHDHEDVLRLTPPGTVGVVFMIEEQSGGEIAHHVHFPENDAWVILYLEEITDTTQYEVTKGGSDGNGALDASGRA